MSTSPGTPAAPLPLPTPERLEYLFRHVAQDPGAQWLKTQLQRLRPPAQP